MRLIYKILIALGIIILLIIIGIIFFAYRNMHYDILNEHFLEKNGYKLGFKEGMAQLDDGSEIYYIEGPDNGPKLLLLHGQQASCYDYAKVLPKLSKEFHVFALDYYGHGKSSKNPDKYNAVNIGNDIIWFIDNIIKDKVYISGHSSGALLASYISANAPDSIIATVLEDGPFFATLPGRAQKTISWLGFKNMYDYLNQNEIDSFMKYSLENDYMQEVFNAENPQAWNKIVKNSALTFLDKHPGEVPKIWFYPPELGINSIYALNANLQDGTSNYDLRFGVKFYDFSWFDGFDQEEILKNIKSPTIVMHVAPSDLTKPSYYDKNGILLAAMDETDAQKVVDLIPNSKYIGGFKSSHDIHADLPNDYIKVLLNLKNQVEN
ncbi:MAG: alpha/beta hydrolase [Christensenellaceae bacterium]|nr:alpha/beta hydrolase [Christensenellaceae bacterium]